MKKQTIRNFLDNPDAVLFVGSGVSQWSGLPSWDGLIGELADFLDESGRDSSLVRRESERGDLLQAASYGFDKLSQQSIGEFIRAATRLGSAKPSELHKALVSLGPTCFVTTNYDNLIEQALSAWRSDEFYRPPITNTQLASIAEIMSARASHYIYKFHGDASDSESIILTREQYRVLMPGGERHNALEAIKTILLTRPVIYIGFGLRDPDFLYIKDILLNTFKGAAREHVAIVANVDEAESEYWSRNYGIRLFGYDAPVDAAGRQDHSALLLLLSDLSVREQPTDPALEDGAGGGVPEERRALALARYAASVARLCPTGEPIEIRVSCQEPRFGLGRGSYPEYDDWTATRFLTEGPSSAVLVGLPGAGKSFSLKLAAAALATKLQNHLLNDPEGSQPRYLPVFVDLKLYQGDLSSQLLEVLPPGFTLKTLQGNLRVKIFFDAYNEMPLDYFEAGSFLNELSRLALEVGDFDYVVSSRTTDGLVSLTKHTYELSQFDPVHVDSVLDKRGVVLAGNFADDVKRLLARPFFLSLLNGGSVDVTGNSRPRDIYQSYIDKLDAEWALRSSRPNVLSAYLSTLAFRALDDGREAFPIGWLADHRTEHTGPDDSSDDPDVLNWLISKGVLLPYTGGRVSFVHQSITEYLAAHELIRRHSLGGLRLSELVEWKKWDQCLFLAISLMDGRSADQVLSYVLENDLVLALGAVRFAEEGQEELISRVLTAAEVQAAKDPYDFSGAYALSRLPFTKNHAESLKRIASARGSWGATAVKALATISGYESKEYLLDLLEKNPRDYNFVANGLVWALQQVLEQEDLDRIARLIVNCPAGPGEGDGEDDGPPVGALLDAFPPSLVISKIQEAADWNPPAMAWSVVAQSFRDRSDAESFHLLLDMLRRGHADSVFALFLRIRYGQSDDYLEQIDASHIESLWQLRDKGAYWAELLKEIFKRRPDLRETLTGYFASASCVERIALAFSLQSARSEVEKELRALSTRPDSELDNEPFHIFDMNDLDWAGLENIYAQLIGRRHLGLASSLLGGATPCDVTGLGRLGLKECLPILSWMAGMVLDKETDWWKGRQLGSLIAQHGDLEVREHLIKTLEAGATPDRIAIAQFVLPFLVEVSTDTLGSGAISLLMSDLSRPNSLNEHFYNPLGSLATERFVEERLIPLARSASPEMQKNLRIVLAAAGDRHGRRYLLSGGKG